MEQLPSNQRPALELLAPAGDRACLEAALEAGADAVFLGLTSLNARRRARNFSEQELAQACALAHGQGRRIYLTLNIDLAQDELSQAARMLELASRLKVDAVLLRDPALLALKPHFPELEYHLSTQACVANSADVEAARELGARRVVLAREMTLAEIATASSVAEVETEVFVHGALCFCVSGRCLLSSWVGGRSGNRGACTGPCRVPWTLDGRPGGTPFSMHDLSLATRVDELRAAGVRALKLEGRMKNPTWVRASVTLLRKAIDGTAPLEELAREAQRRGATPGRKLTSGYLDDKRDGLVEVTEPEAEEVGAGPKDVGAADRAPLRAGVVALLGELEIAVAPESPRPDRVRLSADQASGVLERLRPRGGAIVEGLDAEGLERLVAAHPGIPLVAALPGVFFEEDRAEGESLVAAATARGAAVEVNTWGGWQLARRVGARIVGGPGLAILNALTADELARRGFEEATVSVEADALKIEALLRRARLPCSIVVFGRPALMTTRAELPAAVVGAEVADRFGARLRTRRAGALWELRPVDPFDLRGQRLPREAAHLVVDLVGSPDPMSEWNERAGQSSRFNFDRLLA